MKDEVIDRTTATTDFFGEPLVKCLKTEGYIPAEIIEKENFELRFIQGEVSRDNQATTD